MLKKIRLALYDKSDYMKNFMQYLYRQKYHALETRLFTSFENLFCQAEKRRDRCVVRRRRSRRGVYRVAQSDSADHSFVRR